MESVNSQALLSLASSKQKQALLDIGGVSHASSEIQASLERQYAEQRQVDVDTAALEILKLKRNKQEFLVNIANQLVTLKAAIAAQESLAAAANLADAYGNESENFLPLQKILSGVATADKALSEVPKGWEPAAQTVAAE